MSGRPDSSLVPSQGASHHGDGSSRHLGSASIDKPAARAVTACNPPSTPPVARRLLYVPATEQSAMTNFEVIDLTRLGTVIGGAGRPQAPTQQQPQDPGAQ